MELILSSSVLILVVVLMRFLLKGKISLRLQYALWLLVAIRLLVPVDVFENPFSIANFTPEVREKTYNFLPVSKTSLDEAYGVSVDENGNVLDFNSLGYAVLSDDGKTVTRYLDTITSVEILKLTWLAGIIIFAFCLIFSNLRFFRKLKGSREKINIPNCFLPIYTLDGLASPCLYGLFRPAIYLTRDSIENDSRLESIVSHELTHYRHRDHLWAFVRSLCLCIHWYNPLVWIAVALSRRDSELACDEGTLKKLGEEKRGIYGKTLIEMMTAKPRATDLLCCATTMTGGRGEVKERISLIAKKPKVFAAAVVVVVLVVAITVICTFGGAAGTTLANAKESSFGPKIYENIAYGELVYGNKYVDLSEKDAALSLELVSNLKVDKKEISRSRDESRDMTNRLKLVAKEGLYPIYLNFSKDFTEVWVDNGVKPGFSYRVREPYQVEAFFRSYLGSESVPVEVGSIKDMWANRTSYIGNNAAVGNLVSLLSLPGGFNSWGIALQTSKEPYGLTVNFVTSKKMLSSADEQAFEAAACILFALVENLGSVEFNFDASAIQIQPLSYTSSWANETVGVNLWESSSELQDFEQLLSIINDKIYK